MGLSDFFSVLHDTDGFDMCRIMDTKDLRYAINYLQQKPSRDDCLHLYAQPQDEQTNPCEPVRPGMYPSFFKLIEPKLESQSRSSGATEDKKSSKIGPLRRSLRKRARLTWFCCPCPCQTTQPRQLQENTTTLAFVYLPIHSHLYAYAQSSRSWRNQLLFGVFHSTKLFLIRLITNEISAARFWVVTTFVPIPSCS